MRLLLTRPEATPRWMSGAGRPFPVLAALPIRIRPRSLAAKYALVFALLVAGGLLASGAVQTAFAFSETQASLARLQREKAMGAAASIGTFLREIERQVGWVVSPPGLAEVPLEQRRDDFHRLLRQVPAITEVSYLDAAGREQLRVSQRSPTSVGSGLDGAGRSDFLHARSGRTYVGPVTFREESEPHLTMAIPDGRAEAGVITVDVNLKLVRDVINDIRVGREGYAYAVDATGHLVVHTDISLVLKKTSLDGLPQVQAARRSLGRPGTEEERGIIAPGPDGRQVLSAYGIANPPGWLVFVEQPLEEAFAPLAELLGRTALLLLGGLLLAVLASLAVARRLTTPIRGLQAGAARIGGGALDQRLEIRTGDELEALADEFNRMAARLRESYAGLEQTVQERTRELAEALRAIEEQRQRLEVAGRHKSEFLAHMSHELRTPLHGIIGFSDVLLDRTHGELSDRQERYVRNVQSAGRHLLALIEDILDLSKIEAGRMDLELRRFVLSEVLESGLTLVRERASRQHVALSLAVDPPGLVVEADERKVKQVVVNLLSNAVKFTPPGGRVDVEARASADEVRVSVRDTGVGIAPEDQARIFESFEQVGGGRGSAAKEGTGLGLALARRLVELHGGELHVLSTVGVGSTFSFTLPRGRPTRSLELSTVGSGSGPK